MVIPYILQNHPKRFTDYHIHYLLEGELPKDKVVRAIQLSKLMQTL